MTQASHCVLPSCHSTRSVHRNHLVLFFPSIWKQSFPLWTRMNTSLSSCPSVSVSADWRIHYRQVFFFFCVFFLICSSVPGGHLNRSFTRPSVSLLCSTPSIIHPLTTSPPRPRQTCQQHVCRPPCLRRLAARLSLFLLGDLLYYYTSWQGYQSAFKYRWPLLLRDETRWGSWPMVDSWPRPLTVDSRSQEEINP